MQLTASTSLQCYDLRMLLGHRVAVRAVILCAEQEVLLLCRRGSDHKRCWFTPGGGIEAGESHQECLQRELLEELGLERFELEGLLGRHDFVSLDGTVPSRNEHYIYLVRAERIEAIMRDCGERQGLEDIRWFPLAELSDAREPIYPLGLSECVLRQLAGGGGPATRWL
jgi:8-oxo-dGTP pyrophosphatase MutT (NUDIX family)